MSEKRKHKTKRRGNGEGSIFYRKDRALWGAKISIGYDENGKRKRKTIYGKTKKEVQEKLAALQHQRSTGTLCDDDKLTMSHFLESWLQNSARLEVRPSTHVSYCSVVKNHINPQIGGVRLSKLSPPHVDGIMSTMEEKGLSPRTRELTHAILHRSLEKAVKQGMVPRNVCKVSDSPSVPQTEMQFLTQEQAQAFLKATKGDRLHSLYVLAITTGMRQGEMYGLRWEDIDLESGDLSVNRTVVELKGELTTGPPKTKKSRRRIKLSQTAIDALCDHRALMMAEGHAGCEWVFCDRNGGLLRRQNVQRRSFKPTLRAAKLPDIRFHDLRHTAATLLLMAGVNIKVVSEMLGHSKVSITLDTYAHVLPTMQQGAADHMDNILAPMSA